MIHNDKHQKWKLLHSYIYDYVHENNLDWPVTTCAWGPMISSNSDFIKQKIYFACRTDGIYSESDNTWSKLPCYIVVAHVDIPIEGKYFNQELRNVYLQDNLKKHKHLKVKQIIMHPGDINIMRKCHLSSKIIATKNDQSQVNIWDLDRHRSQTQFRDYLHANIPDITLIGHLTKSPSFALDWAKNSYRIGSGSKDTNVLIWDIDDYQTKLSSNYMQQFSTPSSSKRELSSIGHGGEQVRLKNNITLSGHTEMVEDISFSPVHKDVLISVGDDKRLLGWDTRASFEKQFEILNLHNDDINCVDWSILNEYWVATGSSDGSGALIDIRNQKKIKSIILPPDGANEQKYPIMSIKFCPLKNNIIGIGSNNLYFYNLEDLSSDDKKVNEPFFSHFGQKGVINDFDWNPEDIWSVISTCQELESESVGGGSLHLFRPLDLLCMPNEQALQKLSYNLVDIYTDKKEEKKKYFYQAQRVNYSQDSSNKQPQIIFFIDQQHQFLYHREEFDDAHNLDEEEDEEEGEEEDQELSASHKNNDKMIIE